MRLDFVCEKSGVYACWDYDSLLQLILSDIRDTAYGPFALVEAGHRDHSFHFPPMRIGLQDMRSQREWLQEISRLDGALPWAIALRDFCLWVLRERGRGEDPVLLLPQPRPDNPYLISPYLPLGETCVLFGDGGAGKSLFALAIALSYSADAPVVPGLGFQKPGPVLWLDFERSSTRTAIMLGDLQRGRGLASSGQIYYQRLYRPLADMMDAISRWVDHLSPSLIIVDSQGAASGGEIERAESTLRFFRALASLERTALVIAHVTKAQANTPGNRTPYGSIYGRNAASVTWDFAKTEEVTDPSTVYGFTAVLRHDKTGTDRRHPPIAHRITFPAQQILIDPTDVPDIGPGGEQGARAQVMSFLMDPENGPGRLEWSYQEIAGTTGLKLDTVSKTCRRLLKDGAVAFRGAGQRTFVRLIPRKPKGAQPDP